MTEVDPKRKLVNYFKKNISKGYTIDSLKWALVKQGYSRIEITRAIEKLNDELSDKAPILKEKPVIKYEIIDENNNPVKIKKPWWKRLFG